MMWPFKWKLSTCIYTWCYLFFKISQHEIWKFGRNLLSAKFGSEKSSRPTPQTDHVVLTSKTELDPSLETWQLCTVRCSYRLKLLTPLIPAKQIKQQMWLISMKNMSSNREKLREKSTEQYQRESNLIFQNGGNITLLNCTTIISSLYLNWIHRF